MQCVIISGGYGSTFVFVDDAIFVSKVFQYKNVLYNSFNIVLNRYT